MGAALLGAGHRESAADGALLGAGDAAGRPVSCFLITPTDGKIAPRTKSDPSTRLLPAPRNHGLLEYRNDGRGSGDVKGGRS